MTETSDVEAINIVANNDGETYSNPIIADGGVKEENMPAIVSRDQVNVSGQTELVQIQKTDAKGNVQGTTEQIYAYASGSVGTTEKTAIQNTTVSSTLGVKVLDAADTAGEKAYSTIQQDNKKDEVAGEAVNAEVTSETNSDGSQKYVVRIGGKGYETLQAALNAVTEGQTVTLLADSDATGLSVSGGKTVTLDLGDYDLTNTGTAYPSFTFNQTSSGTIIIKGSENSVINGSIRLYDKGATIKFGSSFLGKVEAIFNKINGTISAEGGYFKNSVSSYIADGYTTETADSYTHVVPITADNALASAIVAGETKYFVSFDKAFDAAKVGGTVTLLEDYSGALGSSINYYATGDVTLDLNGHTWDLKAGNVSNGTGIRLYSGNLTV